MHSWYTDPNSRQIPKNVFGCYCFCSFVGTTYNYNIDLPVLPSLPPRSECSFLPRLFVLPFIRQHLDDMFCAETYLRSVAASHVEWTIVGSPRLTDGPATGTHDIRTAFPRNDNPTNIGITKGTPVAMLVVVSDGVNIWVALKFSSLI